MAGLTPGSCREALVTRVREARRAADLRQTDVAGLLNMHHATYAKYKARGTLLISSRFCVDMRRHHRKHEKRPIICLNAITPPCSIEHQRFDTPSPKLGVVADRPGQCDRVGLRPRLGHPLRAFLGRGGRLRGQFHVAPGSGPAGSLRSSVGRARRP